MDPPFREKIRPLALALVDTFPLAYGHLRSLSQKPAQPSHAYYFACRDAVGRTLALIFQYFFVEARKIDGRYWYEWAVLDSDESEVEALRYVKLTFGMEDRLAKTLVELCHDPIMYLNFPKLKAFNSRPHPACHWEPLDPLWNRGPW